MTKLSTNSSLIFFMKDVGEVKLVSDSMDLRPVVDLLFHGISLIFDITNYNVVIEPYAILFVLQVICYKHIVWNFFFPLSV